MQQVPQCNVANHPEKNAFRKLSQKGADDLENCGALGIPKEG